MAKVLILSKKHPKGEILGKYPLRIETPWPCAEGLAVTRDRGQPITSEIYQKLNASDRISQIFEFTKKLPRAHELMQTNWCLLFLLCHYLSVINGLILKIYYVVFILGSRLLVEKIKYNL